MGRTISLKKSTSNFISKNSKIKKNGVCQYKYIYYIKMGLYNAGTSIDEAYDVKLGEKLPNWRHFHLKNKAHTVWRANRVDVNNAKSEVNGHTRSSYHGYNFNNEDLFLLRLCKWRLRVHHLTPNSEENPRNATTRLPLRDGSEKTMRHISDGDHSGNNLANNFADLSLTTFFSC